MSCSCGSCDLNCKMVVAFKKNVKPAAFKSSVNYSSSAAIASAMQTHNLIGEQESHDADI